MRIVLQRVLEASVRVNDESIASINKGLCLLVGFGSDDNVDTELKLESAARKICALRVFSDEQGKLMHDLAEIQGELLLVPQFTLYASVRKGRRPDFIDALRPDKAEALFNQFVEISRQYAPVRCGQFGADMKVALVNDGPFTLTLNF